MKGERLFDDTRKILLIIFFLSFIFLTAVVWTGMTDSADDSITRTLSEDHGEANLTVFRIITDSGSTIPMSIATLLVTFWLFRKDERIRALFFPLMMLASVIYYSSVKLLIQRPRPEYGLINEVGYAFPSGHATGSMTFFLGLYVFLFFAKRREFDLKVFLICLTPSIFIGISRVFLAVHYPTDIIGGFLAGTILVLTFDILSGKVEEAYS